jgi:hypothetical protein
MQGTTSPTNTFSNVVSLCQISSSTIKITLGKSIDAVDFFVVINRASNWAGGGTITGTLSSYGMPNIQVTDATANKAFVIASALESSSVEPEVKLKKICVNTMDTGIIRLLVTLKTLSEWGLKGRAFIEFPNYYRPDIGRKVTCILEDANEKVIETLYCVSRWDHSLVVYGPKKTPQKKSIEFGLRISGVSMNKKSSD